MGDCIFCKIIEGMIPSSTVFEDSLALAFLDINPASKGHLLILPRRHVENFSDLGEQEILAVFAAAQKIAAALPSAVDNTGFNLLMNYGKDAGQVIPHLHFHIIPRKKEDGLPL
jgi:histidine triad (HIT) family protein